LRHNINKNGDLVISVDKSEQAELRSRFKYEPDFNSDDTMYDILEHLICNSELEFCTPEDIGALTDAPILCIRNGKEKIGKAWGFMNYQIRSVQQDLAEEGYAIFQNGGVN
jgi:hypothetical protein